MTFEETDDFARAMDVRDPVAIYRERFSFPKTAEGDDCIYFCGHSLPSPEPVDALPPATD